MYDYCDDGSYDVIICGTYQMLDALTNAAADYPDQKFIFFDEAFDFSTGGEENVYNVMYKQNEVSYLIGAMAAMMTTDESLDMIDPSNKIIGFLGGMETLLSMTSWLDTFRVQRMWILIHRWLWHM